MPVFPDSFGQFLAIAPHLLKSVLVLSDSVRHFIVRLSPLANSSISLQMLSLLFQSSAPEAQAQTKSKVAVDRLSAVARPHRFIGSVYVANSGRKRVARFRLPYETHDFDTTT